MLSLNERSYLANCYLERGSPPLGQTDPPQNLDLPFLSPELTYREYYLGEHTRLDGVPMCGLEALTYGEDAGPETAWKVDAGEVRRKIRQMSREERNELLEGIVLFWHTEEPESTRILEALSV